MFKKIKDIYKILAILSEIKECWRKCMETKKGFFSSEFFITVLGVIGSMAAFFLGKLSPETFAFIMAIVIPAYSISRTVVKKTATTKDDEILAMVEKTILSKMGIKTEDK